MQCLFLWERLAQKPHLLSFLTEWHRSHTSFSGTECTPLSLGQTGTGHAFFIETDWCQTTLLVQRPPDPFGHDLAVKLYVIHLVLSVIATGTPVQMS